MTEEKRPEELAQEEAAAEAGLMDEESDGQPQPQLLITKRIEYRGVIVGVTSTEDGSGKRIHIVDPSTGTEHLVPLSSEYAKEIGESLLLSQGIQVASPAEAQALGKAADAAREG